MVCLPETEINALLAGWDAAPAPAQCPCGAWMPAQADGGPCDDCKADIYEADMHNDALKIEDMAADMAREGREYGDSTNPADYREAATRRVMGRAF